MKRSFFTPTPHRSWFLADFLTPACLAQVAPHMQPHSSTPACPPYTSVSEVLHAMTLLPLQLRNIRPRQHALCLRAASLLDMRSYNSIWHKPPAFHLPTTASLLLTPRFTSLFLRQIGPQKLFLVHQYPPFRPRLLPFLRPVSLRNALLWHTHPPFRMEMEPFSCPHHRCACPLTPRSSHPFSLDLHRRHSPRTPRPSFSSPSRPLRCPPSLLCGVSH